MTHFIRLLEENDKSQGLFDSSKSLRVDRLDHRIFTIDPYDFFSIPTAPFAYWVGDLVRKSFVTFPDFEAGSRTIKVGLQTSDDFRFVRSWWEVECRNDKWKGFAKGGAYSPFYSDVFLKVNWNPGEAELWSIINPSIDKPKSNIWMLSETIRSFFFRPGLTWPRRTKSKLSMRILPADCVFADKGPAVFSDGDSQQNLLYTLAISSSRAFQILVETQLAAADAKAGGAAHSFEAGVIQRTPVPETTEKELKYLSTLSRKAWSLKRTLDTTNETSHAFLVPAVLRDRVGKFDVSSIEVEIAEIQAEIDRLVFDLYGFSEVDRDSAVIQKDVVAQISERDIDEEDDELAHGELSVEAVMSWAVGVALGRFDWRLVTGEREAPPEPEPFDPLPTKSPGMLPDGAEPFHRHAGILVDDEGQKHDLPRLIELVLETVDAPVSEDIRRWLRQDFFPFHLQQYSKSRRKAPIYWPLSTASGSYTLWLYYPELTNQMLFTAVNDFVEPKLNSVRDDLNGLRTKGDGRSKQEEKTLEKLEDLEQELADLRDKLLEIAPGYRPNQDDGVQITAAPLWSLFRHKPWQKVLKDTWKQLEKGDYDWAHLALNYWPDRVLRKCHEDRSLAIAHDVEEQFWEEVEVPVIRRGKDTGETKLEWQPKDLSEAQLQTLINQVRQERSL